MPKLKKQITIDHELNARTMEYCEKNYMTFSGMVSLALNQYLITQEVPAAIADVALSLRKIASTGEIDDETMKRLDNFETLAHMLTGSM